jgi:hypothetical protein
VAGLMCPTTPDTAAAPALDTSIEELAQSFRRAAQSCEVVERSIRIGDAPVRMRFAGARLAAELSRAFDHLADETGDEAGLTIHVWDSEDSGTPPPPLPAVAPDSPRGTTQYATDDLRHFACRPGLGQLSAYDGTSSSGWFWCRNARELPFWEPAAPFRQILHWWLPDQGSLLLHGAAVGHADGGVLLVGAGGSGKSTCALSSLTSDLLYAGDDYVGIGFRPEPRVVSLFCSGKLEPDHATLLPHLPAPSFAGDGAVEEKSVFYVAERYPERMCRGFPLRAIIAPRVRGDRPDVRPLASVQALTALAPSTLFQLVPARQEALSAMARLLEDIPAFALDVGGPTELIPPALETLLRELAA